MINGVCKKAVGKQDIWQALKTKVELVCLMTARFLSFCRLKKQEAKRDG